MVPGKTVKEPDEMPSVREAEDELVGDVGPANRGAEYCPSDGSVRVDVSSCGEDSIEGRQELFGDVEGIEVTVQLMERPESSADALPGVSNRHRTEGRAPVFGESFIQHQTLDPVSAHIKEGAGIGVVLLRPGSRLFESGPRVEP